MLFKLLFLIVALLASGSVSFGQYIPPQPTVLPLQPRGLRVSIPDEPGISLIAFHGKINEDFDSLEAGTMSRDIIKARNGRWTFEDRSVKLREGDTVYFWLHVVYEGLGYNLLDQHHRVTRFYNYDGTPAINDNDDIGGTKPCAPSVTKLYIGKSGESPTCSGQLLFEDNFSNLNLSRWEPNERFAGEPDYEFVIYENNESNVKVEGGLLRLSPMISYRRKYDEQFIRHGSLSLERCTGQPGTADCQRKALGFHILPPVISGRVDTKKSFAFLYGRVEIRAKLPSGDWIYPLLMLEPLNKINDPGYETGQIKVASAAGNKDLYSAAGTDIGGRVLMGGAVASQLYNLRENTMSKKESAELWTDDFHTYSMEWRHDRVVVSVDGVVYGNKGYEVGGTGNVRFDKPFYLTLGVAVGGRSEFPDNSTSNRYAKPWRNIESKALYNFFLAHDQWSRTWNSGSSLEVDYVKVWAL